MRATALLGWGLAWTLVASLAPAARADTVKLKNGDTLSGTIVNLLDGKVTLKTAAEGDVKIDAAQIETIATDAPIEIHLKDGQVLKQKAVAATGGTFTTEATDTLGAQTVKLSDVEAINPPPRRWTGSITASGTWTRGNSYSNAGAIDVNAVNRGDLDRLTVDGWYRVARSTDATTGDTATTLRRLGAEVKYDYFFEKGSKLYAYGNMSGEKDGVAELDLRFIAGVGAGYQWLETDTTKFSTEGGMDWFSENYSNSTSSVNAAAARVAYHFTHKFPHDLSVFHDTEAYKVFADPRDYLVKTRIGARDNFMPNFFAEAKIELQWDPTPAAGQKRTDVLYLVGLGWTF